MLKWCQLSYQITCNFLLAVSSNNVSIMHSFLYITTCNREWPSSILQFEYNSWNSIVCVWRTTIMYLVSCIIHVLLKIFALETFPVSSMIFKGRSRFLTMTCVDGSYDVLFMFYSRPKCAYDMMYLFREIEPEGNCHRILYAVQRCVVVISIADRAITYQLGHLSHASSYYVAIPQDAASVRLSVRLYRQLENGKPYNVNYEP